MVEIQLTEDQYDLLCYSLGLAVADCRKHDREPGDYWHQTDQKIEELFNHVSATVKTTPNQNT